MNMKMTAQNKISIIAAAVICIPLSGIVRTFEKNFSYIDSLCMTLVVLVPVGWVFIYICTLLYDRKVEMRREARLKEGEPVANQSLPGEGAAAARVDARTSDKNERATSERKLTCRIIVITIIMAAIALKPLLTFFSTGLAINVWIVVVALIGSLHAYLATKSHDRLEKRKREKMTD
jgi:hypothetical protein